jgi:hypothetical protein
VRQPRGRGGRGRSGMDPGGPRPGGVAERDRRADDGRRDAGRGSDALAWAVTHAAAYRRSGSGSFSRSTWGMLMPPESTT